MTSKIGPQIERLRVKLAVSQTEFGKRFHTTAMSVSRWEHSANPPDARCLLQLGLMAKQQHMDGWMFWNQAGLKKEDARAMLGRA